MKKKISKIMGVMLTAVLLCSLVALPVSAAISQPSVSLSEDDISKTSDYTILFQVTEAVPNDATGEIVVEFPAGTTVPAIWNAGEVWVQTTAGFGALNANTDLSAFTSTGTDDLTVTIVLGPAGLLNPIGEFAQVKVVFDGAIVNPDDPDDYTLTVETSEESAVESASYEIEVPDIGATAGLVQVISPGGYEVARDIGDGAIALMMAEITDEGWTIKIGPGTYDADTFDTAFDDTTFEATGAAEDTIIELDVIIDNAEINLDGFTFQGEMTVSGDDCAITDCVFEKSEDADETLLTFAPGADDTGEVSTCIFDTTNEDADDDIALFVDDEGLDVSDCSFIVDETDVAVSVGDDVDIDDCEFTGSSGVGVNVTAGSSTADGCIFDGLANAFDIDAGTICIAGNSIINSTGDAIVVDGATEVIITGNTISDTDEEEYALVVNDFAENVFVIFNNFTGNTLNVDNNDTGVELDCSNNWWGDADGPDSDSISDDVDDDPVLAAEVTGSKVDTAATSLDAETAAGVKVSADAAMDVVGAASYADNPGTATDDPAVGYHDVYVDGAGLTKITIRLYGDITEDSMVMVWSTLEGAWVEASDQGANTFSGYAWCTAEDEDTIPLIEELGGTAFAVVTPPPPEPEGQAEVEIVAPTAGGTGVQLSPTFAWSDVGTPFYEFQLSDNPYFAEPLISDSPKLRAPYFDYPADLEYSKTYFWRVRSSISGATSVCVDTQCGPWSMGIFTTMDEPVEPPEIVFPEPQPPVVIPPVQEITPSWIYVIIGVGALLVIAVIVLIVTTRRATP